jgi:hypothetical protein
MLLQSAMRSRVLGGVVLREACIMSTSVKDGTPAEPSTVRTRPLFQLREQVPPLYVVGRTPSAFRRIGVITGGSFEGERLSGEVVSGGNDWQDVRGDGCTKLDVRLLLKTTDDSLIVLTYQMLRHGPPALMQALDRGDVVGDRHPDGPV